MYVIKVYRKKIDSPYGKPALSVVKAVLAVLAVKARIRRPGVEDLFLGGAFALLPALSTAQIDAAADRSLSYPDAGVVLALGDLGRVGSKCNAAGQFDTYEDARSCAQSILLWIKKNLADVVDPSEVSIVVEKV
jgi:hypothetical protein